MIRIISVHIKLDVLWIFNNKKIEDMKDLNVDFNCFLVTSIYLLIYAIDLLITIPAIYSTKNSS